MTDKRFRMPTSLMQVVTRFDLDGQPCENVFYAENQHADILDDFSATAVDEGAANVVGARVKSWLQDHWSAFAHTLASCTEIDVVWNTVAGTGPLQGLVFQDLDFPIHGTNSGDPLPNNCTIAVELRTAFLGRSAHGRQYAVGLNDGHIDVDAPNRLKAASLTDIPEIWQALVDSLKAATDLLSPRNRFPMQIASFVSGGADRPEASITAVASATISDPYLDSMRRRLPGHNRHR